MVDVKDILEIDSGEHCSTPSKDAIIGNKKRTRKSVEPVFKRPEGMHRELYALLYSDQRDPPTLCPSDTSHGYKQPKAKIGRSIVRHWKRMPFTNPARSDGLVLLHWRRAAEEGKEYPFAQFNKKVNVPEYTDEEYNLYLHDESGNWSRAETDHLFDLCRLFDVRFIVIHDRYNHEKFKRRSVEDLKDRYYCIVRKLTKARMAPGQEPEVILPEYDAEHERNRKIQLQKLYDRTPEQVEEEEMLIAEHRKIELRKKDREKKQQDIQKLITAAESKPAVNEQRLFGLSQPRPRPRKDKKTSKKKARRKSDQQSGESKPKQDQPGIKFPEIKGAGVYLRSSKLKMPQSVGTKKSKAVEQLLDELGVELYPMPTEQVVQQFNELRNDLLLLYELKHALGNCEFEIQTLNKVRSQVTFKMMLEHAKINMRLKGLVALSDTQGASEIIDSYEGDVEPKHKFEAVAPGKDLASVAGFLIESSEEKGQDGTNSTPLLIDVVAPTTTTSRKRRSVTSLLDTSPWKKTRKV